MRLLLVSLLGTAISILPPSLLATEETSTTPAITTENTHPPSKEAASIAKKILAAGEFDPQTYTCQQFLKELQSNGALINTALIWAHGYLSAVYGTDEMGPLDAEVTAGMAQDFTEYCIEHPKTNFSRAANFLSKQ